MISRRAELRWVVGVFMVMLAAVLIVNARLSWQPVTTEFGQSIGELRQLPLVWRNDAIWLLAPEARDAFDAPAARAGLMPQTFKTVRNWNREKLLIARVCESSDGVADVSKDQHSFVRTAAYRKLEFCRNGRKILDLQEKGHANRWNVMTPDTAYLLALSPSGERLIASSFFFGYGDYRETLAGFCNLGAVLFDTRTGRQIRRQSAFEGGFTDFAWSPNGKEVAGITVDGFVFILDGQNGKLRRKFRAHRWFGAQIAWSNDGKTLVTATNPRLGLSPQKIRYDFKSGLGIEAGGGILTFGEGKRKTVVATDASNDTTWNGKTERLLKRFDAQTGKPIGQPMPLQTGAVDLQFSPDGTELALGQHNFALVLDTNNWKVKRRLQIPAPRSAMSSTAFTEPICVAWSPDGNSLATSTYHGLTLWRMH